MKVSGRSSTITNAFINSIIPVIEPSEEEIRESLRILDLDPTDLRCAYCGDNYTEWDHFRPIVVNQRPTGYISEIHNLVPSCGKCNQSKRGENWKEWITSNAPRSPKSRGVKDLPGKIARLAAYELWGKVEAIDFEKIVGEKLWKTHWDNWRGILQSMHEAQDIATELKLALRKDYDKRNPSP